jgi:hypothetical protein
MRFTTGTAYRDAANLSGWRWSRPAPDVGAARTHKGLAAMMRLLGGAAEAHMPFAPPCLRDGELIASQTANILFYLAPKLRLAQRSAAQHCARRRSACNSPSPPWRRSNRAHEKAASPKPNRKGFCVFFQSEALAYPDAIFEKPNQNLRPPPPLPGCQ